MNPLKAYGIDGLHALFYQSQWDVVGSLVYELVSNIFKGNPLPPEMFRPISLCPVMYKTVTKILANRLKGILPELIGPTQTSFVPGRQITENIVMAQEIIHTMRNKRGKIGQMAVKVDLEKAYDRLRWDFIHDTLKDVGLPKEFIRITMECITTARMQILWGGEITEEFTPSRGIRQGDPLSPYIFVLCIERLSHAINLAVRNGSWCPIRLSRNGVPLTHLIFTDDLLLLAEASCNQAHMINNVLNIFCSCSGELISKQKTRVYFSKNVTAEKARKIIDSLGFAATDNLGKYLGMPLLHNRVTKATYQEIVDNVDKKLSGWNAMHLSLAGRITLAQSVIQAIHIFAMQTTRIPHGILYKIDRISRRFIWGSKNGSRKLSLINWEMIYSLKAEGGLGFKNLTNMNNALLMKIGWNVLTSTHSHWIRVLRSKYGLDSDFIPSKLENKCSSYLWKGISRIWEYVLQGTRWSIGKGNKVNFWHQSWVSEELLIANHTITQLPDELKNKCVADFVDIEGNWNWSMFGHFLPNQILLQIAAIKPPSDDNNEDQPFWAHSKSSKFTSKSAYISLNNPISNNDAHIWKLIWHWKGPQRIRIFLWLEMHGRIKTKEELFKRHIQISMDCEYCGQEKKDVIHALRDCVVAKRIWNHLVLGMFKQSFFSLDLRDWLCFNLGKAGINKVVDEWACLFGVAVWKIWFWRNQFIFIHNAPCCTQMVTEIRLWVHDIHFARAGLNVVRTSKIIKEIGWQAPSESFFQIEYRWFSIKKWFGKCWRIGEGLFWQVAV
ncbi:reverse transcriptase domain-containing protein [Citrus sinensis]|nr:reverse transcriptase domain-containing protein [Citrus sinensis]